MKINLFWLSIFQNHFSSEDISTLSNLPKTHSSADSGNLIYHTNSSQFALSIRAIAILMKKVFDTNVIGKCVAYIHYSYANKYVCFYCVSENKSLYKYFGYVKQQILKTNFLCGFTKNL